ncbi:TPA: hypothetical protein N0F65_009555 [Lagenidium giganteum]|uniref:Sepiapterin reductase n=1 Tax=Lagenidium giganteum TaxID=4803 RepID=A0AAV2YRU9_9STRA|nr:TPA: hypothetical protein N0F65_009555 [Lagenidium giganteum]
MKTGVLVTGASRGFGRCLALDFCNELTQDVDIYLWARHGGDLAETERLVKDAWQRKAPATNGVLRTMVTVIDLGKMDDYQPKIDAFLAAAQAENYDRFYLVHNAGSLGELSYTQEWSSCEMLDQFMHFNVTSVCWFNKRFLEVFGASRDELRAKKVSASKRTHSIIVNITSLCAIQSFETHGLYCTSKAAREMHHRVIALEQAPCAPTVRVLSYSPGPMDTDMQRRIREEPLVHEPLQQMYGDMKTKGTLIPPEKSSLLGVRYVLSGTFESGSRIDYYDIAPTN